MLYCRTIRLLLASWISIIASLAIAQDGLTLQWQQAYNRGDSELLQQLYTPDARLEAKTGDILVGADSVSQYWQQEVKIEGTSTSLTDIRTVKIGDHAVITGQFLITDLNGVLREAGNFSQIWRVDDAGDWKIHRERWANN